ncbi:Uncharacterised protein [Serratia fonticola]|nr:Uncharacterised protein [Serratia fonticola]
MSELPMDQERSEFFSLSCMISLSCEKQVKYKLSLFH